MLLTDEELKTLESANTADEWNDACLNVKRARNGQYPPDWYPRVIMGGVLANFGKRSNVDTEIKISAI
jgi:hypothetical protein